MKLIAKLRRSFQMQYVLPNYTLLHTIYFYIAVITLAFQRNNWSIWIACHFRCDYWLIITLICAGFSIRHRDRIPIPDFWYTKWRKFHRDLIVGWSLVILSKPLYYIHNSEDPYSLIYILSNINYHLSTNNFHWWILRIFGLILFRID